MKTDESDKLQTIGKSAMASIREMTDRLNAAEENNGESIIDEAREAIHRDPLCVEVRSDWYAPGGDPNNAKPGEYRILLSTGGPATRIIGDLDDYCQPLTAKLEAQDWFLPWAEYRGDSEDDKALLTYAGQFWFGE